MTLSWLEMTECESVFDTSALVKIFHNEEGSERTRELILMHKIISIYWILRKLNTLVQYFDDIVIMSCQKNH